MLRAAALLLLAVAFGACTQPNIVATSPSPTPSATATRSPAPTATPTVGTTPKQTSVDRDRIFFVRRDGVPTAIHVAGSGSGDTATDRVTSRLRALLGFKDASSLPPDIDNAAGAYLQVSSVTITADLATANLVTPNGSDPIFASELVPGLLAKQLVYTASEEPGIRRVSVTVNGRPFQTQVLGVTTWPKQREDVYGYGLRAPVGKSTGIVFNDATGDPATNVFTLRSTAFDGSRVRFTFETFGANDKVAAFAPFEVSMEPIDDPTLGGKYALSVNEPFDTKYSTGGAAHVGFVNQSPVVSTVQATRSFTVTLDDARPWRAYMPDASHLVVEVGGDPRMVSDSIAVWTPSTGDHVGRTFQITGAARVFEASVVWRVQDDSTKVVASGNTTASIGTSPIWGTYSISVSLPSEVTGGLHVVVFWISPRDGTEVGGVSFPLNVP